MATTSTTPAYGKAGDKDYTSSSDDGQAIGNRKAIAKQTNGGLASALPPTSDYLSQPAGNLLKGATDENGNLKGAALMVGIKLDLEAEVHLTARVRGDITVGLY